MNAAVQPISWYPKAQTSISLTTWANSLKSGIA
jgi:hypothetical protein